MEPDRLIHTFEFEGAPGQVMLTTITFDEIDNRTTLTERTVFQSIEHLEGMVKGGMEQGTRERIDRLVEVVQTLQG